MDNCTLENLRDDDNYWVEVRPLDLLIIIQKCPVCKCYSVSHKRGDDPTHKECKEENHE